MNQQPRLVLASGSPRRKELLAQLGVVYEVIVSDVDEELRDQLDPSETVLLLARQKVDAIVKQEPDAFVLGADTEVFLDGRRFGKPSTLDDARAMLRRLSGRTHQVLTGVVLWNPVLRQREERVIESGVTMKSMSLQEIEDYVATGEPMDRAGSYAIQGIGGELVAGVEGCYTNVIGLPLCATVDLLTNAGFPRTWSDPACRLQDGFPCRNTAD
jgi:septum formation protein